MVEKLSSSILLIFIDGLGIGPRDPDSNPLTLFEPTVLRLFQEETNLLPCQGELFVTDAKMGVSGIPQSATGQTALFTGRNASRLIGRHLHGFPNRALKQLISQRSLFRTLKEEGGNTAFANAYAPSFFQNRPRWISVTTTMCETSNTRLRTIKDLLDNRSVYMDFTNRMLRRQGYKVPLRSPVEAGHILAELSGQYDLCLYEYFLTDWIGHRGTPDDAVQLLQELDQFLAAVIEALSFDGVSLVVTSDHGNIENMLTRRHTLNPVGTMVWGDLKAAFRPHRKLALYDVAHIIHKFLRSGSPRLDSGNLQDYLNQ